MSLYKLWEGLGGHPVHYNVFVHAINKDTRSWIDRYDRFLDFSLLDTQGSPP